MPRFESRRAAGRGAAAAGDAVGSSRRVLTVDDRITEVLFGLIMVLTFTGSLSVAEAGRAEVRTMLIGALGCNLAWGIIDAVMYLLGSLLERGRNLKVYRAVRTAATPELGRRLIADVLPPLVASNLDPEELEKIRSRLGRLPEPPSRVRLHRSDVLGALGVLLLVFLSTFPVVIPFLATSNAALALRVSDAVAILMLFGTGLAVGRSVGGRPLLGGLAMVILGVALVSLTLALGG